MQQYDADATSKHNKLRNKLKRAKKTYQIGSELYNVNQ